MTEPAELGCLYEYEVECEDLKIGGGKEGYMDFQCPLRLYSVAKNMNVVRFSLEKEESILRIEQPNLDKDNLYSHQAFSLLPHRGR